MEFPTMNYGSLCASARRRGNVALVRASPQWARRFGLLACAVALRLQRAIPCAVLEDRGKACGSGTAKSTAMSSSENSRSSASRAAMARPDAASACDWVSTSAASACCYSMRAASPTRWRSVTASACSLSNLTWTNHTRADSRSRNQLPWRSEGLDQVVVGTGV
jgi:hypothetical protein